MGVETGFQKEEEKKYKKISEKELKNNELKKIEYKKTKEKISIEIKTEENLLNLKELIESGIISKDTAKKIIDGENIEEEIIKEIFEKIEQIEEVKNIDKYIPKELRITKEAYIKALNDDIFRVQLLTKIDSSLVLLAEQINPDMSGGLNLFSGFLNILDKNLILIQENTIDVKNNLVKIDKEKFNKKEKNINFLQKIIFFFKELIK